MKRILLLLAILALSFSAFSCGGGGAASSNSPAGENPGIPSVMQMSASHNIAQTNASITLHAKVLDGNGAPIADVPVTFTNLSEPFGVVKAALRLLGITRPIGVLSATVVRTDGNGIARVSISSTVPGFATVQAEVNTGVGIVRDKKTVFFSSFAMVFPTPPPPTLSLHVDDGDGVFDQPDDFILFKTENDNQRTIRADVLDSSGHKVVNSLVTFGADSTEATFPDGNVKRTDANGQAFVRLLVTPASVRNLQTVINITATADNGASNILTLFLRPVVVAGPPQSYLTANPSVINVNGTSTITAVVKLNTGAPVADNTAVNFTVVQPNCGFVVPFGQTVGGVATATYSGPPTPKTCTIAGKVGSVSIGTVDVVITTSLTVQPSTQTVNGVSGGTATFTIFGGSPSYTITASNAGAIFAPSPATVTTSGGTFTVTIPPNTPAASVTYTIRDSAGAVVTATLTIGGGATLSVQPGTQTISGVSGGTATFTIFGGNAPYTVASNNTLFPPVPPAVSNSGDTFVVTVPASTPAASVVFTVRDSAGATATATLAITAGATLSVQPGSQTVNGGTGGTATFTVFGGLPGYTVTSANPVVAFNTFAGNGIWNVTSSGGTFVVTVPAGTAATSVALTVRDSSGATVAATLAITAPGSLRISPPTVSVLSSGIPQAVNFTITGGTAPYITTSSDPSKVFNGYVGNGIWNGASVTASLPVNVAAGTVTLNVFDSLGATTTATITIIAPPPGTLLISPKVVSVVSAPGPQALAFAISGGTAPYITTSSDPTKAFNTTVNNGIWNGPSVVVTFPGNVSAGSVTLNVLDSVGGTTSATITILSPGAANLLAVTPSTVSVTGVSGAGDSVTFTISGGVAPYQSPAFSSNTAVVPNATVSGSTFTINPNPVFASTAVTMTVLDNVGTAATATVTVTPFSSSLGINPSSIALDAGAAPVTFTILGGTPNYTVYTSNSGCVSLATNPITVVGPSPVAFTATIVSAASCTAIITVVDSASKTVTANVTVNGSVPPPTPTFTVLPPSGALTCTAGGTVTFVVTGGAGPNYIATSSNPNVVIAGSPVTISGGNFTATVAAASCGLFPSATTTVPIIVTDSGSGITTVTLTVSNP